MTDRREFSAALAADIGRIVPGARVVASEGERYPYGRDLWPRHQLGVRSGDTRFASPAAVAFPRSAGDVSALVRFAARASVPLVPYGAGSGVCGGIAPTEEALVVDLKELLELRLDDAADRLSVGAGWLGSHLEEALSRRGFTLGHFPSSIGCSTVGGWVATRSAGQCSGYYGKIEDMVVDLDCVDGDGTERRLHRRAAGLDLSALVVGSEGALGVVTRATLRVHPAPAGRAFLAFGLADLTAGMAAMRAVYQAGLRPAVCRLYDAFDARLLRSGRVRGRGVASRFAAAKHRLLLEAVARPRGLNAAAHSTLGARALGGALLVFVIERATQAEASADSDAVRALVLPLARTDEGEAPARRWLAHRYAVSYRQAPAIADGLFIDTFEVAAPWSRLAATFDGVRAAAGEHAFVMAHLSHAYADGCCIYFSFAGAAPPRVGAGATPAVERQAIERYDALWRDILQAAHEAGATVSHHHGVGRSKANGMAREIVGATETVAALKRAFDPAGIFNPGVLASTTRAVPRPNDAPTSPFVLDETSHLAFVRGDRTLADLRHWLAAARLDLRGSPVVDGATTVGAWLAAGAPGAPDPLSDPADHVVAGLAFTLPRGSVVVPPTPRRATGPDFTALAIGARGRFGARVDGAWLRVGPLGSAAPPSATGRGAARLGAPAETAEETALAERIARALNA